MDISNPTGGFRLSLLVAAPGLDLDAREGLNMTPIILAAYWGVYEVLYCTVLYCTVLLGSLRGHPAAGGGRGGP